MIKFIKKLLIITLFVLAVFILYTMKTNISNATDSTEILITDSIGGTPKSVTIDQNMNGAGWSWKASSKALYLSGFNGERIVADGDLKIVLSGQNKITMPFNSSELQNAIESDYQNGTITIDKIQSDTNDTLTITGKNIRSEGIIHAKRLNLKGGTLNIGVTNSEKINKSSRVHGIYCNSGTHIFNYANLNIGLISTSNDYSLIGLNSLHTYGKGNIYIRIESPADANGVVCFYGTEGSNKIIIASSTTNGNYYPYAIERLMSLDSDNIELHAEKGMICCNYGLANNFPLSDNMQVTTDNPESVWIVRPIFNTIPDGVYETRYYKNTIMDAKTGKPIKDGINFVPKTSNVNLEYVECDFFNIASGKRGENMNPVLTPEVIETSINLKNSLRGINKNENTTKFEIVEGTLPKGITMNSNGMITGKFEKGCKAGQIRVKATRASDNKTLTFTVKYGNVYETDLPFWDIEADSWYVSCVDYVYQKGLIKGYSDPEHEGMFGPNDKITRAQIVTILYRMEGSPNNDGKSKFTDVNSSEWYAKPIKWAVDKGIVHGYDGTTKFGPDDYILRQDFAGILRNYAKYKGKNVNVTADLTKFSDYKKIDDYAKPSMQWAVGKGVITGNDDGTLNPKGNATRAEAAAMIQKYCNKVGN